MRGSCCLLSHELQTHGCGAGEHSVHMQSCCTGSSCPQQLPGCCHRWVSSCKAAQGAVQGLLSIPAASGAVSQLFFQTLPQTSQAGETRQQRRLNPFVSQQGFCSSSFSPFFLKIFLFLIHSTSPWDFVIQEQATMLYIIYQ